MGHQVWLSSIALSSESDKDLQEAAVMLMCMRIRCANCGAAHTPQWRKGWKQTYLCNACGIKFGKGQHCDICMYVYSREEISAEKENWITCTLCGRKRHQSCNKDKHDPFLCKTCKRKKWR